MPYLRFARIAGLTACVFVALILALAQQMSSAAAGATTVTPLLFLDGGGTPLRSQAVWLSCFSEDVEPAPLSQQWVRTDEEGLAVVSGPCPAVAALVQRHVQPSGKVGHGPAYSVFAASWPTGAGVEYADLGCPSLLCPAGSKIFLRDEWPLILFHVVASVEWEAGAGDDVADLRAGLRAASGYLADLSDGYMAFGPLAIHTGGRHWEGADFRIQAANDLRPAAFVGGMAAAEITYSTPAGRLLTFRPGAIFAGRGWDRRGAAEAGWSGDDGWRTLAHEWAHYALYLYDEYQADVRRPVACPYPDLRTTAAGAGEKRASAMSWHYSAGELWHPAHTPGAPAVCTLTDQYLVHGESDWETLAQWHTIQGLAAPALRPAPLEPQDSLGAVERMVLDHLFGSAATPDLGFVYLPLVLDSGTGTGPGSVVLHVRSDDRPAAAPSQSTQVYLLEGGAGLPSRILYQGTTRGGLGIDGDAGSIGLLGWSEGDDLRVAVERYASAGMAGGRFVYPAAGAAADVGGGEVVAQSNTFSSSLNLSYQMAADALGVSRLTTVTVELRVPAGISLLKPLAQLCTADPAIGCPRGWEKPLTAAGGGLWTADFGARPLLAEFPLYNLVRVRADNPDFGELVRWFRDAGGVGPGHKPAGAPLLSPSAQREGPATIDLYDLNGPPPGACNRVLVMPLANYAALLAEPAKPYAVLGVPLDIDVLLGSGEDPDSAQCRNAEGYSMWLTLFYNEEEIVRPGVDENNLKLLRFDGVGWQLVGNSVVDSEMNWIAAPITSDGMFAIGY